MIPPLLSDAQFNSLSLVVIAAITIIPGTLGAFWARSAKKSSAETAREVRTNGGMKDPHPNINDHIKYQTEMLEQIVGRQDNTEALLANHIAHSKIMDAALAEVYLVVKPSVHLKDKFNEDGDPVKPPE